MVLGKIKDLWKSISRSKTEKTDESTREIGLTLQQEKIIREQYPQATYHVGIQVSSTGFIGGERGFYFRKETSGERYNNAFLERSSEPNQLYETLEAAVSKIFEDAKSNDLGHISVIAATPRNDAQANEIGRYIVRVYTSLDQNQLEQLQGFVNNETKKWAQERYEKAQAPVR